MDWEREFGYKNYVFKLGEIRDLAIASVILGILFSIPIKNFLISLIIVAPALVLHELAHKLVAQRYDCKAFYKLWPIGALLSMVLTILTLGKVIFAALGAVVISPTYSRRFGYRFIGLSNKEIGKISISGPLVNISLAILCLLLSNLNYIFFTIAQINIIIAIFNLIPFPPLDGAKVFAWSRIIWGSAISSATVLFFLPSIIGVIIAILLPLAIFLIARIVSPWKHPEREHVF